MDQATSLTTLTAAANPSSGQTVIFTATVTATISATGTPTGMVTFKDGTKTLGKATLANGEATFVTSALAGGPQSITASYGGNTTFLASASGTTQTFEKNAAKIPIKRFAHGRGPWPGGDV